MRIRNLILALLLVLVMAVPAFADPGGWSGQQGQGGNGGNGGNGGAGGNASATIGDIKNTNTNLNTNINTNKVDNKNTNVNINEGNKQGQLQGQGQSQGQMQGQVNEGNTVSIVNEKQFLGAPSTNAPEVNFGAGKVIWGFGYLGFRIPAYKMGQTIVGLVDSKANIKGKNLIETVLKMEAKEGTPCTNMRIILVDKEAQKSYTVSIIGAPAGSGVLGSTDVSGSAVVGPSFAGTKANNLYDAYFVKILWANCK